MFTKKTEICLLVRDVKKEEERGPEKCLVCSYSLDTGNRKEEVPDSWQPPPRWVHQTTLEDRIPLGSWVKYRSLKERVIIANRLLDGIHVVGYELVVVRDVDCSCASDVTADFGQVGIAANERKARGATHTRIQAQRIRLDWPVCEATHYQISQMASFV